MYKHILIPTDGSEVAEKAVSAGIAFARENGARVTLFTAVPEYAPPSEVAVRSREVVSLAEHERRSEQAAGAVLARGAEAAHAAGIEYDTDWAQHNHPWEAIVQAAKRNGCDAIVMGSHGRKAFMRLVHGSQALDVLSHCDLPTLVVR
ncbi:MAG TPA: universal stress protein [Burkholderiales bacterium]|jgi:nucleotide-binding universal stress UspA family protein